MSFSVNLGRNLPGWNLEIGRNLDTGQSLANGHETAEAFPDHLVLLTVFPSIVSPLVFSPFFGGCVFHVIYSMLEMIIIAKLIELSFLCSASFLKIFAALFVAG